MPLMFRSGALRSWRHGAEEVFLLRDLGAKASVGGLQLRGAALTFHSRSVLASAV